MRFKVGDKVKLISTFFNRSKAGALGIIVESYPSDKELPYRIEVGNDWSCPVHTYEIKLVIKIGQQLEFAFMEK